MSETLLIIEDETLLGKGMQRRFAKKGWHVMLASNLTSARHYLVTEQLQPLVVIADMSLPDGSSLDLLEELQQTKAAIGEWILLTAYGTIPDSVRALQLRAHDFLEKPVDDSPSIWQFNGQRGVRAPNAAYPVNPQTEPQNIVWIVLLAVARALQNFDTCWHKSHKPISAP